MENCTIDITADQVWLGFQDRKTYQCHPSYRTIGKAVKKGTMDSSSIMIP